MLLRTAGLLAVAAGVVNGVSDFLLQGGLAPRAGVNTFEQLAEAPYDLVFLGSIVGNAAIPFWLLGFWPVYVALAPAGRPLALPPVLLLAYAFSLFPGYHGSYALYAAAFQAETGAPAALAGSLSTMVERFHHFHDALLDVIAIGVPLGSIWFTVVVALGRTHYARWMALVSPILAPLTQPLAEALPAPFGGFIRPAWGTTIFTVFFLLATIVTWNLNPGDEPSSPSAEAA